MSEAQRPKLAWPDGVVALLVRAAGAEDPDLAPFVGEAHLGESVMVWPRGGVPHLGFLTPMERDEAAATGCRLMTPEELEIGRLQTSHGGGPAFEAALLERAFQVAGVRAGKVAVAGRPPAGDLLEACGLLERSGWRFQSGQAELRMLRKSKTGRELASARRAAAGAAAAFRRVAQLLAAGFRGERQPLVVEGEPLTVGRLRRAIGAELARHGLEQPHGNIVAAGAEGAVPHTRGDSRRVLAAGESLVVDLFPKAEVFADCTRTFCVGEPPAPLAAAHAQVAAALAAAHQEAVAGRSAWDLQRATCDRFSAAGYATPISDPGTTVGYVHGLGHGVGYELHELPSFRKEAGATGRLETGDLLTLEPGLYDPAAEWGVRLEDLCAIGPEGLENLTPLPYDLDPRAW